MTPGLRNVGQHHRWEKLCSNLEAVLWLIEIKQGQGRKGGSCSLIYLSYEYFYEISSSFYSETKSWIEMEYLFSIPAFSYWDSIKIMPEKKKLKICILLIKMHFGERCCGSRTSCKLGHFSSKPSPELLCGNYVGNRFSFQILI